MQRLHVSKYDTILNYKQNDIIKKKNVKKAPWGSSTPMYGVGLTYCLSLIRQNFSGVIKKVVPRFFFQKIFVEFYYSKKKIVEFLWSLEVQMDLLIHMDSLIRL